MLSVQREGVKRLFETVRRGGQDVCDLADHLLDSSVVFAGDFKVAIETRELLNEQVDDVIRHFVWFEIEFIADCKNNESNEGFA